MDVDAEGFEITESVYTWPDNISDMRRHNPTKNGIS